MVTSKLEKPLLWYQHSSAFSCCLDCHFHAILTAIFMLSWLPFLCCFDCLFHAVLIAILMLSWHPFLHCCDCHFHTVLTAIFTLSNNIVWSERCVSEMKGYAIYVHIFCWFTKSFQIGHHIVLNWYLNPWQICVIIFISIRLKKNFSLLNIKCFFLLNIRLCPSSTRDFVSLQQICPFWM